ncbi:hypothetical protein [Paracoccus rhizosphaerae]|uniref:Uncharacterized protein n=1 Tax=Paracoccus rhizosphaerae TaxID=1133347 RepID=A0ABV6CLS1_9RHOB|nr:hypothetical protein [Paracoccus rhizosphaerae]
MLTSSIKTLMAGGRVVTASALLATTAMAQTTTLDTPQGNTVIVPDDALEAQPSVGYVLESDYPRLDSIENNTTIAQTLISQGYSDVVISREGPILTVTAVRGVTPIELVYSTANGRLVSVDGVETREAPEGSSAGDQMGMNATADGDAGAPDAADGAEDSGMDDGGTGTDDGDTGGEGSGADGDTGGDASGADGSGADGGDAGGSDSAGSGGGSDGGDSDGGDSGGEGGSDGNG